MANKPYMAHNHAIVLHTCVFATSLLTRMRSARGANFLARDAWPRQKGGAIEKTGRRADINSSWLIGQG